MSPENQAKSGAQRQKIMIVVTVIVFLFVGYNIIGLLRGGGGEEAPAPVPAAATNKPGGPNPPATGGNMAAAGGAAGLSAPAAPPIVTSEPKQTRVQGNAEILRLQAQTQSEYLNDLNNLQLLKVQREIAETKQAIAAAKLATITAETNIADSLTGSKGQAVPAGTPELNMAPGAPPVPIVAVGPSVAYSVMSVSFQGRRWTAVVKVDSKMLNVTVGDSLPDGSVVQDINRNGITLKRDTTTTKLTLPNTL